MFVFYILIFSKHGHLIASHIPEDVSLDFQEELLSGFFSAIQISYNFSYNTPLLSIGGKKNNRIYFFNDEAQNIIYAINCSLINHMEVQSFLKELRDIINERFKINGDNPCYYPSDVNDEMQKILIKKAQELEDHVKTKYFVPI